MTSEVSQGSVAYLIVLAASAGDVLFPLIPSEAIVIAASILAAQGDLLILLIVAAAATGALLGDNAAYLLGRHLGKPAARRMIKNDKARARFDRADRLIRKRGIAMIVGARFIPGGRTATTLAAGTLDMSYGRFLPADVCAALAWAIYASMLGYVGGSTFKSNFWLSILLALGLAGLVTVLVEYLRKRHQPGR